MLLERINSPADLKKLRLEELNQLASEIRARIIEVVSSCGGHLASSLGAVELAIALHYCLDTPKDKIIWDVGHQAYAHKILTGRNKVFATLRQYQGLSGFPSKEESPYDPFTTGHSSTAVSLALGLACAQEYLPFEKRYKVVAVIGDGSLSGGLCFEGLNNTGHLKKDILVILNTNELSIAPNVGALSTYLNKLISLPIYNRFRQALENFVRTRVPKGSRLLRLANKFEEGLKGLFIPGIFFEELGFRYFGPLDGHNLAILIPTINNILNLTGPNLLHVITKKGKGYPPAEADPVRFHSAVPFEIKTGKSLASSRLTYTQVFSQKLVDLAKVNKRIIAITAAMPEGTGLDRFRNTYPDRFFDVGIAEEHAVCFASGLAEAGLKPVVAIYSTFLQRAYDQLIEEIALQDLGVVLAVDRAGIVGEDGPTHQGIFDLSFLRHIPNLVIMAPQDARELEMMLEFAINLDKPVVIRYPKAFVPDSSLPSPPLRLAEPVILKEGKDILVIALGSMVIPSFQASNLLEKEGIKITLVNPRFVKPLNVKLLKEISQQVRFIFTVEEAVLEGGFGSAISEVLETATIKIGLPSEFICAGKRDLLLEKYGLTGHGIASKIKANLK
ncbi:MAG: 1-deoxy-D-xylulose-5-phosphate synthase [Candidatus Omnitrophica bacterium]|nr:1-deoxy-D-xylulose-5-phosphate synthase [Candidatus Omnitrophota bacterium]